MPTDSQLCSDLIHHLCSLTQCRCVWTVYGSTKSWNQLCSLFPLISSSKIRLCTIWQRVLLGTVHVSTVPPGLAQF